MDAVYTPEELIELDEMILAMDDFEIKENFLSLKVINPPEWYFEAWSPRLQAEMTRRGLD